MLAPKCATYNGRSTFANPKYLKIAQSEKPCLYEIPYDTSDHANRFCPNGEETVTLEKESRSKLNKDTVKPYDSHNQNSSLRLFTQHHPKPNLAPFLNVQMTFEQRSSSLVLHQMTSDHNRLELGILVHSNEQSSSKLVPKVVP
ncbi:hypothetical protein Tco_0331201 [Tanacetum coccineum]